MLSFESDYIKGAHEKILERLCEMNQDPQPGYGSDAYCERAKEKIRKACGCPDADIFFLIGGTQTNAIVIDGMLQSFESSRRRWQNTAESPSRIFGKFLERWES